MVHSGNCCLSQLFTAVSYTHLDVYKRQVQLVARDGKFFPAELIVPQGRKIRIEIRNEGKDPVEFESMELRKEKVLAPDSKSVVVIVPQQPGSYKFFDDFHPKTGQGVLVVK